MEAVAEAAVEYAPDQSAPGQYAYDGVVESVEALGGHTDPGGFLTGHAVMLTVAVQMAGQMLRPKFTVGWGDAQHFFIGKPVKITLSV